MQIILTENNPLFIRLLGAKGQGWKNLRVSSLSGSIKSKVIEILSGITGEEVGDEDTIMTLKFNDEDSTLKRVLPPSIVRSEEGKLSLALGDRILPLKEDFGGYDCFVEKVRLSEYDDPCLIFTSDMSNEDSPTLPLPFRVHPNYRKSFNTYNDEGKSEFSILKFMSMLKKKEFDKFASFLLIPTKVGHLNRIKIGSSYLDTTVTEDGLTISKAIARDFFNIREGVIPFVDDAFSKPITPKVFADIGTHLAFDWDNGSAQQYLLHCKDECENSSNISDIVKEGRFATIRHLREQEQTIVGDTLFWTHPKSDEDHYYLVASILCNNIVEEEEEIEDFYGYEDNHIIELLEQSVKEDLWTIEFKLTLGMESAFLDVSTKVADYLRKTPQHPYIQQVVKYY